MSPGAKIVPGREPVVQRISESSKKKVNRIRGWVAGGQGRGALVGLQRLGRRASLAK